MPSSYDIDPGKFIRLEREAATIQPTTGEVEVAGPDIERAKVTTGEIFNTVDAGFLTVHSLFGAQVEVTYADEPAPPRTMRDEAA